MVMPPALALALRPEPEEPAVRKEPTQEQQPEPGRKTEQPGQLPGPVPPGVEPEPPPERPAHGCC
jgi:hypothetical protein